MKYLALAIIAIGLMLGDFGAHLWLDKDQADAWSFINSAWVGASLVLLIVWGRKD